MSEVKDFREVSLIRKILFILLTILAVACLVFVLCDFFALDVMITNLKWCTTLIKMGAFTFPFLISLFFIKINKKNVVIMLSLICVCVSAYFLIDMDITTETNQYIMLGAMCGFQVIMIFLGLLLEKGVGLKVIDLAIRMGLSLLAWFLLPSYLPDYFTTMNLIFTIYLINSLITIFVLCFKFKVNFLLILGLILILAGSVLYSLKYGSVVELSAGFSSFLNSFDISYLLSFFGVYLVSINNVFIN